MGLFQSFALQQSLEDESSKTACNDLKSRAMRTRWKFPFPLLSLAMVIAVVWAQNPPAGTGPATQGVGLIRNDPGAFAGYTLLSPLQSTSTFLIDMSGSVVKT